MNRTRNVQIRDIRPNAHSQTLIILLSLMLPMLATMSNMVTMQI